MPQQLACALGRFLVPDVGREGVSDENVELFLTAFDEQVTMARYRVL